MEEGFDPRRQTFSYRVGRFIRRRPLVTALGVVAIVASCQFSSQQQEERRIAAESDRKAAAARAERERVTAVARAEEALKIECAANGKAHTEAQVQLKAGNPHAAYEAVKFCREVFVTNATLKPFFLKVEGASRKQDELDAARSAAIEKEARKRRGVRIGMSMQEALDSNWGAPDTVNRTVTARGTREQWVYRSRISGYLYFEDGVLTTIQN